MKATELLVSEHRLIERVLDVLELATDSLEQGAAIPSTFFLETSDFLAGFADGAHHRKEERVLFRAMVAGDAVIGDGAVTLLTAEHEEGRSYVRAMRDAAARLEADTAAKAIVVRNARKYIELLRSHIEKEDAMIFPLADDVIPLDRQDQVYADCKRVDELDGGPDLHARYAAMAERLEREATRFVGRAGTA